MRSEEDEEDEGFISLIPFISVDKSQSDTPDSKKAIAVLTFIVTKAGIALLNRAISNIQPINTTQLIKITKTLAACATVLVVKLGINLHPNFKLLFFDIIVAGHIFLHCFAI
jgi:hypothetical protein